MTSYKQNKRRYPFKRNLSRKMRRIFFMIVAAALASGINYYKNNYNSDDNHLSQISTSQFSTTEQKQAIEKFNKSENNTKAQFWVGFNGKIVQKLKDDNKGSRHQKFLISPTPDITLLVAHNIDLAPRVPISVGNSISVYGLYEWNNRGGVIHWTHHDPKGKKKGGWIKVNGKVYR